jgi:hypothetical protein
VREGERGYAPLPLSQVLSLSDAHPGGWRTLIRRRGGRGGLWPRRGKDEKGFSQNGGVQAPAFAEHAMLGQRFTARRGLGPEGA